MKHPWPVVIAVAVAAGEAAVELHDAVHDLGAAIVRAFGGEVGQELLAPAPQGPSKAGDFTDGQVSNEVFHVVPN